jgi:hypothetical protein
MKFLVLACILGAALARCPNDCSGRGVCNAGSTCECESNWAGNDCSERVCYYGLAFVDSPLGDIDGSDDISTLEQAYLHHANSPVGEQYDPAYGLARSDNAAEWDEAHFYAECSNKGICDRSSGQCDCFPGFEGEGCQRLSCPNDCSGKGQCVVLGNVRDDSYNAWDADKTVGCVCDPGFSGPDCSLRKCPVGVDPIRNVYTDTSSVYKIEWGAATGAFHDSSLDQAFLPNGAVLWTMTITDDYGDAWTTSAVTTYYNAQAACADATDTSCETKPHYFNDGSGTFEDTTYSYSSSDLFDSSFIGEQVNASIQALPNDVVRTSYVWTALGDTGSAFSFLYPSFSVPDVGGASADSTTDCQTTQCGTNSFDDGPSKFVNDEAYRFPFWGNYDESSVASYLNCADESLCIFIKTDFPVNNRHFEVDYKYQSQTGDNSLSAEYTSNTYDGGNSLVSVEEVGSDRTWLAAVDGTPSIDFNSNREMHVCSKRGMCDYDTGLCSCFDGYSGYRCDKRSTTGIY